MKNSNKKKEYFKAIAIVLAFGLYAFFANIYKARWIGEEPWTKENLIRVGLFFLAGMIVCGGYYYIKYIIRKKKYTEKKRTGNRHLPSGVTGRRAAENILGTNILGTVLTI